MNTKILLTTVLLGAAILPVNAGVERADAHSALITHRIELEGSVSDSWQLLIEPSQWWNSDHTWSGDARNMQLDPRAGGCWCEIWGDSSVEHGRIIRAEPNKHLRLQGGFGPLQGMPVFAVMDFSLSEIEGKTVLNFRYEFSGPSSAQLDQIAPAVDSVMATQLSQLKLKLGAP